MNDAGRAAVRRAIAQSESERRQAAQQRRTTEREIARETELRREFVVDHCEPATAREYAEWLTGYVQAGGEISHAYDYPLTNRGVVVVGGDPAYGGLQVAPADLRWLVLRARPRCVPSLYGAGSVHVVVPARLNFSPSDVPRTFHGGCGHSTFYFMNDFQVVGSWVPLFSDIRRLLEGGK